MNFLDVDPDGAIYRITKARYFLQDLRNSRFTLTRIRGQEWGDPTENPLLVAPFKSSDDKDLTLSSLTKNFFGSCWSYKPLGTIDDWDGFAHADAGIRIESTPRKLMSGFVLSGTDPLLALKYWIGKVNYQPLDEIDAHFEDPNWEKHLDTSNAALVKTVLLLRNNWKNEQEVRLVFDRIGDSWDIQHTELSPNHEFASRVGLPFNWLHAVTRLYGGPTLTKIELLEIKASLANCRLDPNTLSNSLKPRG